MRKETICRCSAARNINLGAALLDRAAGLAAGIICLLLASAGLSFAASPVLLYTVPDLTVVEGQTLRATIHASDPDGDSISYSLDSAPSNTTLTDSVITFHPSYFQAGIDTIIYSVTDHPGLGVVRDTFRVTIIDAGVVGSFNDRSASSGLNDAGGTNAAAWADFNRDGVADVFLADAGGQGFLYRGDSSGVFHLSSTLPASSGGEDASTAAWADFDHDGRMDLYVGSAGLFGGSSNHLYRNDTSGVFLDVTSASGTGGSDLTKSVTWVDFDGDGHPDLHVVNYGSKDRLYLSRGKGLFIAWEDSAGIADAGDGVAGAWCDYDNDNRPDLYLVREHGANRLYHNLGDSTFADVSTTAGVGHTGNGAAAAWGDYDGDGDFDLFLANKDSLQVLYSNNGNGTFTRKPNSGLAVRGSARSAVWLDFNMDGRLDLMLTFSDSTNKLFQNRGDSTFVNVAHTLGLDSLGYWTSATWADPTGDGAPDLYLANHSGANRFMQGVNQGNWLELRLHGVVSNRFGLGSRVRLKAGGKVQTRWIDGGSGSQSQPVALFGLGNTGTVDSLTVFWPSGLRRDTTNIAVNKLITWFETDSLFPSVDSTRVYPDTSFLAGPYPITTVVTSNKSLTVKLFYSTNRGVSYAPVSMSLSSGNTYAGNIPGQSSGTRVRYYIQATDAVGQRTRSPYTAPDSFYSFSADSTRPAIASVTALRDTSDTAGPYTVAVHASDNDSLRAVYLVRAVTRNGAVVSRDSLSMSITGSDTSGFGFSGTIAGQPVGTRVDYYIRAVDLAHNVRLNPSTAPDSNRTFRVAWYSPRDPASAPIRRQGSGVSVADYNLDGLPDIFLANLDSTDILLRGNADSLYVATPAAGLSSATRASTGGWWGDFNNDGYPDLYVSALGAANHLFSNDRDGTFTDISSTAGVGDAGRSWAAAWVDYDNDGLLDLFVVNEDGTDRLYHNNGDSTFTDKAVAAGVTGASGGVGCAWGDYDRDGRRDLYVVYYGSGNRLYHNNGNGTFSEVTTAAGVAGGASSVSAAWFDYDKDLRPDLYLVEQSSDRLYHNNGNGTFTAVDLTALGFGITTNGYTATWGDFDNDSRPDLFKSRGETGTADLNFFARGLSGGTFQDYGDEAGFLDYGEHRGAAWIDYDRDGRQDLLVNDHAGRVLLYHNLYPTGNHYLNLKLSGTRSSALPLGAELTAWYGGQAFYRVLGEGDSYSGQSEPVVHLGLGASTRVDSLYIRWPAGLEQRLYAISADRTLDVTESDSLFPAIVRVDTIPDQYVRGVQPHVACAVQDRDAGTSLVVRYRPAARDTFTTSAMTRDSSRTITGGVKSYWSYSLPEFALGTTVYWRLVARSLRGAVDSTALFSFAARTDSSAPALIYTTAPGIAYPDTVNPVRFVLHFTDGAGVARASFRMNGVLYPSGTAVSFSRDTVTSGSPRVVDWEITAGRYALGSTFNYFVSDADVSGLSDTTSSTTFRVSPRKGKSKLGYGPVNTSDLLRLVYIMLGFIHSPSLVDSLGLDTDRNGVFNNADLDAAKAAWRSDAGGQTLLASQSEVGPEPSAALESVSGGVAFSLVNPEPLAFVLVELETDPTSAAGLSVLPGKRAAGLSCPGGPTEGGTVLVLVVPSSEGGTIPAGRGQLFSVLQSGPNAAPVTFRVKTVNLGGRELSAGQVAAPEASAAVALPRAFTLEQNRPNPFNPSTTIRFAVPDNSGHARVSLAVFNLRGALVRTLLDRELEPGFHSLEWDGRDNRGHALPSGVYFCRMVAGNTSLTRKMILLK